ncbi:hypothetical protein N8720_04095 [Candidatus Marinimicrobia bacterium]|nr:hypothetical protein [Candidatus Neomarinimicrobiota bacterium]
MKCIIPLAGPDFYNEDYGIKPLIKYEDTTLINFVINSRPWFASGEISNEDLIFILRDIKESDLFKNYIRATYPGAKVVTIPDITKGALMTVMSGLAAIKDFEEPIIIDLVDIIYEIKDYKSIKSTIKKNNASAIIPYFKSDNNKYSYLIIDKFDKVIKAKEKDVISDNASTGTYIFKNITTILSSIEYSINNRKEIMYNNLLFVCPSINGLIKKNEFVQPVKVELIKSLSEHFHE